MDSITQVCLATPLVDMYFIYICMGLGYNEHAQALNIEKMAK